MWISIGSGNGLQPDSQHEVFIWGNADFSLVGFRDFRMIKNETFKMRPIDHHSAHGISE